MKITAKDIARFKEEGFLSLAGIFSSAAIKEVRELLDPLFERSDLLPRSAYRDLAPAGSASYTKPRTPEINRTIKLESRLAHTEAYAQCKELAQELAGRKMRYSFDHSIYKAPHNNAEILWHQDQAYTGHQASLHTIHCWIPLQDATVENGCMHFIPGSHRMGLLHHKWNARVSPTRSVDRGDLLEGAVSCPLTVGGVTLHTPLTLHYTGANRTDSIRRAWILHFGPLGRWGKIHPVILIQRAIGLINFSGAKQS